ncbi:RHS repeat-associated core domain-containing protein [Pseudarthrobacter equi]|uniref:RHS repeat-associated core domain-containing protein n=1 Tax=Pseudarthrobacter equi TaxID=728066 RepID=UPI0021BFE8C4|nr:RHS repeat-associated core domain-containing protein [Pseudarthrobacter equi]
MIEYDPNTKTPAKTTTPGAAITEAAVTRHYYQGDSLGTSCGAKTGSLCRSVDGKSNTTSYGYDTQGNPATITRPAPLGTITNTFDAAGRLLTSKDGKNQTRTYTYDNNDRITEVRTGATCTASTCVSTTFDANGNQTQRTDAAGTTTFDYDPQNRATGKTTGGVTTTVAYDKASNITSFTDPTGTVNYSYDAANRLTALAEPGGSCPATPAFPNTTSCTGFDYDKNNRRTVTKYPNGVKNTTVFDNAGRITSITATNTAGTTLASRAYTYRPVTAGTTSRDGSLRATVSDGATTTTYDYDDRSRLKSAVATGASPSNTAWDYDLNSNRIKETKGSTTEHSLYNAADQLCWTGPTTGACDAPPAGAKTYAYDANGNTTTGASLTAGYNTFDQNTSTTIAGATTTYAYAGTTNTERTTAGNTAFLNGSLGITRQTTAGATTSFIRDPDGALISMRTSTGAKHYYTTDALGSVILLTDTNQAKTAEYTYDAWGNTTTTGAQAAINPWQYAGGYKDTTTGYTKFGARYYSPTTGRFTQPDPSNQETNTYLYAVANPVNNSDPTGLYSWGDFWGGIGGTLVSGVGGAVLGAVTKTTPAGLIAGAVVGCFGGALAEGLSNEIDGKPTSLGDVAGACAGGTVSGLLGGAAGGFVRKALI